MFPLQTIKEDGAQQKSLKVGTYLMTELAKLRDKYEVIGDVRGKGLMIGVEMVKDKVCLVCKDTFCSPQMLEQCALLSPHGGHGAVAPQLTIRQSSSNHLSQKRVRSAAVGVTLIENLLLRFSASGSV